MGPLSRFLADDHRRLEALLDRATAGPGPIDPVSFEEFRAGLLRHIGMEEKILLPAAQRARGGTPLPIARQLRLDHGAIAALLVPTPRSREWRRYAPSWPCTTHSRRIRTGGYDTCDQLLAAESAMLIEQLRAFPAVRTASHNDGPLVERHIAQTLALAGRTGL